VKLPPGEKAVGNKWVFKIKHDSEGKVTKYKARLVAKGFTQTYGYNYTDTKTCGITDCYELNPDALLLLVQSQYIFEVVAHLTFLTPCVPVSSAFLQTLTYSQIY
jgi:hypothetical protein